MDVAWFTRTVLLPTVVSMLLSLAFFAGVSSAQSHEVSDLFTQARKPAVAKCKSSFKGRRPTRLELVRVLENHRDWRRDYGKRFQLRNLSPEAKADLRRTNLCGANDVTGDFCTRWNERESTPTGKKLDRARKALKSVK